MSSRGVKDIFEDGLRERIFKSDLQKCNIEVIEEKIEKWKKAGNKIVFTAGVFDIFTINHLLGLHHYKMLGGEHSRLIVSIDTDERVRHTKAFAKDKGDTVKPILSWETRALMVAKQSFNNQGDLVDMIIQHGADTCNDAHCPHDDNVDIAEYIIPDILVVTSSSRATIKKINASHSLRDRLVIINENNLCYYDRYLKGKVSTTAIIERVRHGY